jgi:hypothetical protein
MGGSASSGSPPSRSSSRADDSCDLKFQTNLFGPVPAVVASLKKRGDLLDIQLLKGPPSTVAVFTQGGKAQQAGTIAGASELPDLVRCLQAGHEYEAVVIRVSGSTIGLAISRA